MAGCVCVCTSVCGHKRECVCRHVFMAKQGIYKVCAVLYKVEAAFTEVCTWLKMKFWEHTLIQN